MLWMHGPLQEGLLLHVGITLRSSMTAQGLQRLGGAFPLPAFWAALVLYQCKCGVGAGHQHHSWDQSHPFCIPGKLEGRVQSKALQKDLAWGACGDVWGRILVLDLSSQLTASAQHHPCPLMPA